MSTPKSKLNATSKLKENVLSIGIAILLVFVIRSSVIEPYRIPSGSMIPTLLVGDHIFVNKFSYGLKFPFSEFFLGDPAYITENTTPARGDIIVFKFPVNPEIFYIKRVVALPGDTVQVQNKRLLVNQKPIETVSIEDDERDHILRNVDPNVYDHDSLHLFRESLDSSSPVIMHDDNNFFTTNSKEWTVPAGHVFTMGDNRDHSSDSRIWGFTPISYIKGKAVVTWLSVWIDFKAQKFIFRPSRIGNVLN